MKLYRKLLLVIFFSLFVLFSYLGIGIILNHFFYFFPDKIAVELGATLIYGVPNVIFAILFLILFLSYYKRKKWFVNVIFIIILFGCLCQIGLFYLGGRLLEPATILFFILINSFLVALGFLIKNIGEKSLATLSGRNNDI